MRVDTARVRAHRSDDGRPRARCAGRVLFGSGDDLLDESPSPVASYRGDDPTGQVDGRLSASHEPVVDAFSVGSLEVEPVDE